MFFKIIIVNDRDKDKNKDKKKDKEETSDLYYEYNTINWEKNIRSYYIENYPLKKLNIYIKYHKIFIPKKKHTKAEILKIIYDHFLSNKSQSKYFKDIFFQNINYKCDINNNIFDIHDISKKYCLGTYKDNNINFNNYGLSIHKWYKYKIKKSYIHS